MRKTSFLAILGLLGAFSLSAWAQQDIQVVSGSSPYTIIGRGLNWGGSGPGNVNNNWIFTPVDPNQGFCLFVSNNNTTSAHSFSVAVFQSGDPAQASKGFTGFAQKWFGVPTATTFPQSVAANGIVGISFKTTASAGITVQISGATTQAGSPDTVDVFATQTNQSACGSLSTNQVQGPVQQGNSEVVSNQFPVQIGGTTNPGATGTVQGYIVGAANGMMLDATVCCQSLTQGFISNVSGSFVNVKGPRGGGLESEQVFSVAPMTTFGQKGVMGGYVKTNFMEMATDQFVQTGASMPAWTATANITNPGATTMILEDSLGTAASVNVAYKNAVISCSAACEERIVLATTVGTGCTSFNPRNNNIWQSVAGTQALGASHTEQNGNACTVQPTTLTPVLYDIFLPASGTQVIDLTGLVNFHQSTSVAALEVLNVSAVTGNVSATFTFVEQ